MEIHLNSLAVGMDDDSVTVKGPGRGARRSAAAPGSGRPGVAASPLATMLAEQSGAETDRAGPHPGQPRLHRCPGHPEVFAIGDMVSLNKLPGRGAARAAGGQVRRQGDQGPARRASRRRRRSSTSTRARWRPSATGRPSPTRSASRSPASWPTSCGRSSTSPTSSAGATGSARSTPGRGRWCSPRTAATASSPSSRRTRRPRHHPQPPADTPVIEQATPPADRHDRPGQLPPGDRAARAGARAAGRRDRLTPWSRSSSAWCRRGRALARRRPGAGDRMAAFGWLLVVVGLVVPGGQPLPARRGFGMPRRRRLTAVCDPVVSITDECPLAILPIGPLSVGAVQWKASEPLLTRAAGGRCTCPQRRADVGPAVGRG